MKNILLVDDEPLVIVTLKSLIDWEKYDYQIIMTLANGEEALNYILNHKDLVDVIISDVDMPKMTGIELGKELRRHHLDVALIFLSAYSNFDYVREAFHNGACDYLLKSELDEKTVIDLLTSDKLVQPQANHSGQLSVNDDRKTYVQNCLHQIKDPHLTFQTCSFNAHFPFSLLFIQMNQSSEVAHRPEIQTILEQEGLDVLSLDFQFYVLLVPPWYSFDVLEKHIDSNLWNYMNLSCEYKTSGSIATEKAFQTAVKNIFNQFKIHSRLVVMSRNYIKENYKDRALNLTKIAHEVGVSKNHLSREYSQETGETLVEYISKVRIREAKKLLHNSALKSYEIADIVGFSNVETFFRTFKKVTGETTKTYKNNTLVDK